MKIMLAQGGMALLALLFGTTACQSQQKTKKMESSTQTLPRTEVTVPADMAVATFGSGCFWCTEAFFADLKGVSKVVSGYSGGHVKNPAYREVCNATTGHAEVVQVTYDPKVVTFKELLEVFFSTHDPTTLNRQGNDAGPQYRSAVFYHSDEQRQESIETIKKLNETGAFAKPIVTEVTAFTNYYPAEDYHQEYYKLNGEQPYCQFVIRPKMDKFKKAFESKLVAK